MTKEELFFRLRQVPDSIPGLRENTLREMLQASILKQMEQIDFFEDHAFMGGCALRFLYRHPRFSEDLNFTATLRKGFYRFSEDLDFNRTGNRKLGAFVSPMVERLQKFGIAVEARVNSKADSPVERIGLVFPGILKEAGLSPLESAKLKILLESDGNPPSGMRMETSLVQQPIPVALRHLDLSSLMAGKVAALLFRQFLKGRDWYDLLWYCGRPEGEIVEPNLEYLQSAIDHFSKSTGQATWSAEEWRERLHAKVEQIEFPDNFAAQVSRYLERPEDASILRKENFLAALADQGIAA